jgi:DNA modification methylase
VFETVQKDVEVILDPCLGCGPTLVAGEQRGKTVGALELSPAYVAVILERWHQLSGAIPTCEPAAEFSDHGK